MKRYQFPVLLIFLILFVMAFAKQSAPSADPQYTAAPHSNGSEAWTREQLAKMRREQKVVRQKQLKEDTDKLLQLATDLKNSVDKTNENVLSLDVVKRAEEIEKLAKHIKTNMRDETR